MKILAIFNVNCYTKLLSQLILVEVAVKYVTYANPISIIIKRASVNDEYSSYLRMIGPVIT